MGSTVQQGSTGGLLRTHMDVLTIQKQLEDIGSNNQEVILKALHKMSQVCDNETEAHTLRMAEFCGIIAKKVGMSKHQRMVLVKAAPMHDIGKMAVPTKVFKKAGKLNEEEWGIMKRHSVDGYNILSHFEGPIFKMAAEISLCHHESWDGSGYPYGLAGDEIPLYVQIVAICDVYDALTSKRCYKDAWSEMKTLKYIASEAGKKFSPYIVQMFLECFDEIKCEKIKWDTVEASLHKEPSVRPVH